MSQIDSRETGRLRMRLLVSLPCSTKHNMKIIYCALKDCFDQELFSFRTGRLSTKVLLRGSTTSAEVKFFRRKVFSLEVYSSQPLFASYSCFFVAMTCSLIFLFTTRVFSRAGIMGSKKRLVHALRFTENQLPISAISVEMVIRHTEKFPLSYKII